MFEDIKPVNWIFAVVIVVILLCVFCSKTYEHFYSICQQDRILTDYLNNQHKNPSDYYLVPNHVIVKCEFCGMTFDVPKSEVASNFVMVADKKEPSVNDPSAETKINIAKSKNGEIVIDIKKKNAEQDDKIKKDYEAKQECFEEYYINDNRGKECFGSNPLDNLTDMDFTDNYFSSLNMEPFESYQKERKTGGASSKANSSGVRVMCSRCVGYRTPDGKQYIITRPPVGEKRIDGRSTCEVNKGYVPPSRIGECERIAKVEARKNLCTTLTRSVNSAMRGNQQSIDSMKKKLPTFSPDLMNECPPLNQFRSKYMTAQSAAPPPPADDDAEAPPPSSPEYFTTPYCDKMMQNQLMNSMPF